MHQHIPTVAEVNGMSGRALRAIVFSTNPAGRFAEHLKAAKAELKRRQPAPYYATMSDVGDY